MIETILIRLAIAAAIGTVVVLLALFCGRIPALSPAHKAWICRVAFLKLAVGIVPAGVMALQFELQTSPISARAPLFDRYLEFLFCIWIAGCLAVLSNLFSARRQSLRMMLRTQPASAEQGETVQRLWQNFRKRATFAVRVAPEIDFPMAIRGKGYAVLLPTNFSANGQASAVAHELAHVASGDLIWNLFYRAVCVVFWFHPLIFRLESEALLWQEAMADDCACRMTGCSAGEHSNAILKACRSSFKMPELAAGLSGEARYVWRRLKALHAPKHSAIIAGTALALALAGAIPLAVVMAPGSHGGNDVPARVPIAGPATATGLAEIASVTSR